MKKKRIYIFLKYLGVGVINTLVGLTSVLLLFNIMDLNYWIATFTGNLIGILVSFFLNKKFTFKHKGNLGTSMVKFTFVSLCSYVIAYSIGYIFSHYFDGRIDNIQLAQNLGILISSGIYTILGFFGHKKITFVSKATGDI